MLNIKQIFHKNCKHKKYSEKEIYNDGHDIYIAQQCKTCKKGRTIWINKYFYPAQITKWK